MTNYPFLLWPVISVTNSSLKLSGKFSMKGEIDGRDYRIFGRPLIHTLRRLASEWHFHVALLNYHSIVHIRTFKFIIYRHRRRPCESDGYLFSAPHYVSQCFFEVICKW